MDIGTKARDIAMMAQISEASDSRRRDRQILRDRVGPRSAARGTTGPIIRLGRN
jgi:hypothetical protein